MRMPMNDATYRYRRVPLPVPPASADRPAGAARWRCASARAHRTQFVNSTVLYWS